MLLCISLRHDLVIQSMLYECMCLGHDLVIQSMLHCMKHLENDLNVLWFLCFLTHLSHSIYIVIDHFSKKHCLLVYYYCLDSCRFFAILLLLIYFCYSDCKFQINVDGFLSQFDILVAF